MVLFIHKTHQSWCVQAHVHFHLYVEHLFMHLKVIVLVLFRTSLILRFSIIVNHECIFMYNSGKLINGKTRKVILPYYFRRNENSVLYGFNGTNQSCLKYITQVCKDIDYKVNVKCDFYLRFGILGLLRLKQCPDVFEQ